MTVDVLHLSGEHQRLLNQLCKVIPDFDPGVPEHLQRIFSLGLFALLMQVSSRPANRSKSELILELEAAAQDMIGDMRP